MAILITGGGGFIGTGLSKILQEDKLLLNRNIAIENKNDAHFIRCDLLDLEKINEIINIKKPEKIFHLAGSFTNDYEKDFKLNVTATKNLLEAVKEFSSTSRMLLVGSAAEYGLISKDQCPVNELAPLRPCNVYGLTKIYQKYMMDYYVNAFSLDLVMARPFNLYGRGISTRLFIGKIYKEIENLKQGLSEKISLGNLDSERDYISIEEAAKQFVKIMECGVKGEVYNVGRGIPTKTGDILKKILKEENVDINLIQADERAPQPNDSDQIYADICKLKGLYNE